MSLRKRMLAYAGVACAVLVLAPGVAAVAAARAPSAGAGVARIARYIVKNKSGISLPDNDGTFGEATCPSGTVVLGGGAYIDSGSVATGINASFPLNTRTWEAVANNFSGAATTFNVYAVCGDRPTGYQQLVGGTVSDPAGDQITATQSCPGGDVLLSGGALDFDPGFSVGMTSSYPSTSATWTAAVSNFSGKASDFWVVAVCAAAADLPHYAIPSSSGSDPAGTQKGIIQGCTAPAVVLGGGNQSSNTANLRIEMKTTQPFPASGASWKSGENNDTSAGTTLTSYAICAT
jgi:hypothetical protein